MSTTQQPEALVFANDRPSAIDDDLYQWAIDAEDLIRSQHARILELEAARIAYASEFEPDADGDPDVGNIHANIRALKAQLSAIGAGGVEPLRKLPVEEGSEDTLTMAAAIIMQREADARDAARYRWLRDTDWRSDEKIEPVVRLHLNKIWDAKIDEAMALNKKG